MQSISWRSRGAAISRCFARKLFRCRRGSGHRAHRGQIRKAFSTAASSSRSGTALDILFEDAPLSSACAPRLSLVMRQLERHHEQPLVPPARWWVGEFLDEPERQWRARLKAGNGNRACQRTRLPARRCQGRPELLGDRWRWLRRRGFYQLLQPPHAITKPARDTQNSDQGAAAGPTDCDQLDVKPALTLVSDGDHKEV